MDRNGAGGCGNPLGIAALLIAVAACRPTPAARIDRQALVRRHNPSITQIHPASAFMVGNGSIALTADITGLSTFRDAYSPRVPLMTQAQWAWHSFPNPNGYRYEDSLIPVPGRRGLRMPWLRDWEEAKQPAIAWLRQNPHRFSLARVSLLLRAGDGQPAALRDLSNTRQELDLWTGRLNSYFELEGEAVRVETSVHPTLDMPVVRLRSQLLSRGQLGILLRFPGVSEALNPDPADWDHPDRHQTRCLEQTPRGASFERTLDATRYFVRVHADHPVQVQSPRQHEYTLLSTDADSLTFLVAFSQTPITHPLPSPEDARATIEQHWEDYWTRGGAIDFSGSTDPRAHELERRIVLSQYLMAVNAAGSFPPQEEGLFSNSWNGKFHLEMHPWHAAHFAVWGHSELLERSMGWYLEHLPRARERARAWGEQGAWWPKMVGPEGRESPSTINPFIIWQQPHPIYLSELLYRANPSRDVLQRYEGLVMETAELLASLLQYDRVTNRYIIAPPVVPAQEVFEPLTTFNPAFELQYFRFGLTIAQKWRQRLGRSPHAQWEHVLKHLASLPMKEGLYLAAESAPELWLHSRSPECRPPAPGEAHCQNRDHPSFLAALGFLPGAGLDRTTMSRTLQAVHEHWDLRRTWGWDFPMMAMTATRLGKPEMAVDFLLSPAKNFQFGPAGMTARLHYDPTQGESEAADGPGYHRAAETYFPSNGALLLATALMAAGWDESETQHPGFPRGPEWVVRSEGLRPLP